MKLIGNNLPIYSRNNVPVHFVITALYMLLNLGTGIITSIIEEEEVILPKNESKVPPAKNDKKSRSTNKRQPSPVPSVSNHLDPCLLSVAERLEIYRKIISFFIG